jgi:hypothetical protein
MVVPREDSHSRPSNGTVAARSHPTSTRIKQYPIAPLARAIAAPFPCCFYAKWDVTDETISQICDRSPSTIWRWFRQESEFPPFEY